ncbi:AhpA/YtjB family protein [Endozoicomonas ascidiicola]|uniref:AhpA/YtjB family protein n=1 Tax=Endozoicomonas ascidiicola TaxID=1698521 RepID=UPI0008356FBA|nr:AhpA/YtjB family protein [Endozoicomonas ascidiicola]
MKKRTLTPGLISHFASRFSIRTQLMVIFGVMLTLLALGMSLVINNEVDSASRHQADSIGQLLSAQTASAATDMLVTGDRLSLNVLLRQLVQNPYVTDASIYSIDNQRIASASTNSGETDSDNPSYSSPIHYQDVIAGYARLSLNNELLSQKPKDALLIIAAISLLVLMVGLIVLHLYGSGMATELGIIERQLRSMMPGDATTPEVKGEIARLSAFVEQKLLEKRTVEPEETEDAPETSVIVAIKVKNLGRLQQLLAPRELQGILRSYSEIIRESAKLYGGEVTYTPEGNAYLGFSSNQSPKFTSDALFCSLMIEALVEIAGKVNIASTQLGIGISISEQQSEFPEEMHPALEESAASEALTLANQPEMNGIYMVRSVVSWLPSELPDFEAQDNEVVRIKGIKSDDIDELRNRIHEASRLLQLS